jgi:hypothetical protein
MRSIALVPVLLATIAFAAAGPAALDLDKPGVLDQLKQDHPGRYQAVTAVLRAAERMPCKSSEMETLKTRFDLRDLECGVVVFTSYPAQRHMSFYLDGTTYVATVILKDADATVQPATSVGPAH